MKQLRVQADVLVEAYIYIDFDEEEFASWSESGQPTSDALREFIQSGGQELGDLDMKIAGQEWQVTGLPALDRITRVEVVNER